MPPKKTSKNSTKNKNADKSAEKDNLEAKYNQSCQDVAILQDYIAIQSESGSKVQSDRRDLQRRMRDTEQKLQYERQNHRDVHSDFSRQYKTMQTELSDKAKSLEKKVIQLQEELSLCQEELMKEKRQRELVVHERDTIIAELQYKQKTMESDFEKILHDTLDSLISPLHEARHGWDNKTTALHQNYKEMLHEFNLSAPEINKN